MLRPNPASVDWQPHWAHPRSWWAVLAGSWPQARRRVGGMALALVLEGLMILALLTLGATGPGHEDADDALVSFTTTADRPDPEEPDKPQPDRPEKPDFAKQQPLPQPIPTTAAAPGPKAAIAGLHSAIARPDGFGGYRRPEGLARTGE